MFVLWKVECGISIDQKGECKDQVFIFKQGRTMLVI